MVIWGYTYQKNVEKAQSLFFKKFLCIGKNKCSDALLGDVCKQRYLICILCKIVAWYSQLNDFSMTADVSHI